MKMCVIATWFIGHFEALLLGATQLQLSGVFTLSTVMVKNRLEPLLQDSVNIDFEHYNPCDSGKCSSNPARIQDSVGMTLSTTILVIWINVVQTLLEYKTQSEWLWALQPLWFG